ncbi:hypothetical protein LIER_25518 [Lithospermum erythrorhizon]|uniref:Uncharacterized protein n=1 Tax=Lithospermum erythrorhizon TaxID=34254 RepID=A0AAV3R5A5_LITER
MDEAIPKVWIPLGDSKRPVMPKKMSTTVRAQLETLKLVFDKQLHYKVFYKEGVLIQAGLIQSKEYDPTWGLHSVGRCVKPKDIPFSLMAGERGPLFHKSKVRKVPSYQLKHTFKERAFPLYRCSRCNFHLNRREEASA